MHRVLMTALLLGVLVAACADDGGDTMGDEAPIPVEPDEGIGDGAEPLPEQEPAAGTLTGTLGGDPDLEGGCAWLQVDGTRYEVVYPAGFDIRTDPVQLMGPDGEVIAEEGDEVTVVGDVAEDMMSFCQIGPIVTATDVRR